MSCCVPVGTNHLDEAVLPGRDSRARHGITQVQIPARSFLMGDPFGEGDADDGETPVHMVDLRTFSMDATTVTNAAFTHFIDATGYVTEAERFESSAVFHLQLPSREDWPEGALAVAAAPWWVAVPGASWRHPAGPRSEALADHPVVHVSWNDSRAYCSWAGRRLPSEAEWEFGARGGLEGARYAWGNELTPGGQHRCNIFQGDFPHRNNLQDGYSATAPVGAFPPNGYGLDQMAGNVWEWCGDWFLPHYYKHSPRDNPQGPPFGTGHVMRGGSFLCHHSYCNRYRVAARSSNTADSSSSNLGFRTVAI